MSRRSHARVRFLNGLTGEIVVRNRKNLFPDDTIVSALPRRTSRSVGQLVRGALEVLRVAFLQHKAKEHGIALPYGLAALVVTNIHWTDEENRERSRLQRHQSVEKLETLYRHKLESWLRLELVPAASERFITVNLIKELLGGRLKHPAYTPPICGYCRICGHHLFSENRARGMRDHGKCRTPGSSLLVRQKNLKGGALPDLDLQKHRYAWWLLHNVENWTRAQLAEASGVQEDKIKEGLADFSDHVPEYNKIPKRLRLVVSLIVDTTKHRNPTKFWTARGFIDPSFRLPRASRGSYPPLPNTVTVKF